MQRTRVDTAVFRQKASADAHLYSTLISTLPAVSVDFVSPRVRAISQSCGKKRTRKKKMIAGEEHPWWWHHRWSKRRRKLFVPRSRILAPVRVCSRKTCVYRRVFPGQPRVEVASSALRARNNRWLQNLANSHGNGSRLKEPRRTRCAVGRGVTKRAEAGTGRVVWQPPAAPRVSCYVCIVCC